MPLLLTLGLAQHAGQAVISHESDFVFIIYGKAHIIKNSFSVNCL